VGEGDAGVEDTLVPEGTGAGSDPSEDKAVSLGTQYQRSWYEKNRDRWNAYMREYRKRKGGGVLADER
jgi:hypothetical protein